MDTHAMIRLAVAVALLATTVAVAAQTAGAVGWTTQNHPGGAWGAYYVSWDRWCIGLGGIGDGTVAYEWIQFVDSNGATIQTTRDWSPDRINACGTTPGNAVYAKIGLDAWGGNSGWHSGWSVAFANQGYSTAHPWSCKGCWGGAVIVNPAGLTIPHVFTVDGCRVEVKPVDKLFAQATQVSADKSCSSWSIQTYDCLGDFGTYKPSGKWPLYLHFERSSVYPAWCVAYIQLFSGTTYRGESHRYYPNGAYL
jgi:hypothetical protein